ncbi:hypothetical protein H6G93_23685 [Nostoc sp. FACHB-973]|nr:hypothetical protein [Nostoc sp. FACHB-973]MBX9256131.1 hypothetical protein [Desmonostoc muscorum CCALA 125]
MCQLCSVLNRLGDRTKKYPPLPTTSQFSAAVPIERLPQTKSDDSQSNSTVIISPQRQ